VPLRRRLAYAAAAAVGVAIALVSIVCYMVVRAQLNSQLNGALQNEAAMVLQEGTTALVRNYSLPNLSPSAGGPPQYWQFVTGDGRAVEEGGGLNLPVDGATRALAAVAPNGNSFIEDVNVDGSHLRVFALPVSISGVPGVLQLADSLSGNDHTLSTLRLILLICCAAGIALAAALGRLAAKRVLAPLAEVAQAAEHISETEDLTRRIHVRADDEVGQMATRFNAMLDRLESSRAALDESVRAQRQLVADASHELRTPVTSLRTNVEVLLMGGALSDEDRQRLLADVVEQSEELTALVNDLIELARGDQPIEAADDVRLDGVVEEALGRARRNAPDFEFDAHLEPIIVDGVPERLLRAINNLLDNASRHTHPGTTIEVRVDGHGVRVRDHGDGIDPRDLPHVFDRFYRGVNARGRQGSGLGLAIVRQVAEQHGGSVTAANAPDGGAVFELRLPTSRPFRSEAEIPTAPAPV
jgi:two-component system sensor histidine kinase MprB